MNRRYPVALCAAFMLLSLLPARAAAAEVVAIEKVLAPHVPGEVVVRYTDDATSTDKLLARGTVGGDRIGSLGLADAEVLEVDGTSVRAAIAELEANPDVAYAEPNFVYESLATPNDQHWGEQWALHDSNDYDMNLPEAWNKTTGDGSVTVGVVDTGVAWDHPDLAANIWSNSAEISNGVDDDGNGYVDDTRGWDWVDNDNTPMDIGGHGTHVSGTIGARGNNSVGVAGVAWDVKIMPLRVLGASGSGSSSNVARAFNYAGANGARIVNASFGGPGYSQAIADAVAARSNVLFIVAAGNAGSNNDSTPAWPCNLALENVMCVGATARSNSLASFSNYGASTVDVAAPGVSILATVPNRQVRFTESFESDVTSRWELGGSPAWGPETGTSGNGYSDSPGTLYAPNTSSWIATKSPVDLAGSHACSLSYHLKLATVGSGGVYIETSTDGSSWKRVAAYGGSTNGQWTALTEDLGTTSGGVYLRFRLAADASIGDGVVIDEVIVRCAMSSYNGDEYRYFSGTSMATPNVAGAAALLMSASPGTSVTAIKSTLLQTVTPLPNLSGFVASGGRVNVAAAMAHLFPASSSAPPPSGGTSGGGTTTPPSGGSSGGGTTAPAPEPAPSTPAPTPDPTASPTPTPEPEEITHERRVVFSIARNRKLRGIVVVTDGFQPCAARVGVTIRRNGTVIRILATDDAGVFKTRVPSYKGRYTASLTKSSPAAGHLCSGARRTRVR